MLLATPAGEEHRKVLNTGPDRAEARQDGREFRSDWHKAAQASKVCRAGRMREKFLACGNGKALARGGPD